MRRGTLLHRTVAFKSAVGELVNTTAHVESRWKTSELHWVQSKIRISISASSHQPQLHFLRWKVWNLAFSSRKSSNLKRIEPVLALNNQSAPFQWYQRGKEQLRAAFESEPSCCWRDEHVEQQQFYMSQIIFFTLEKDQEITMKAFLLQPQSDFCKTFVHKWPHGSETLLVSQLSWKKHSSPDGYVK